ncbi:MAG: hypothetical protein LUQ38_02705 [Methanotrichaceae archaeon]|nr:hypothetical protein [Methanotrichaceae archaeon]MDD1758287.1 hypothetical protein [Methanotrichaceae archaeon]
MPYAQGPNQEPISVEMSGSTASVILTQGAINIWFGRSVDKVIISDILITISKVDSGTEHEHEVFCNFHEISEFECNGYILTSYAKRKDKYRAIFVVPFSNARALDKFIDTISKQTEHGDVRITLHCSGGRVGMTILREELDKLDCFNMLNIVYKEEQ